MKCILFALLSIAIAVPSFSQFKRVGESAFFDEPVNGYAKLLHLKNGNTVFLHIDSKEGISLKLYDPTHHLVASKGAPVHMNTHDAPPVKAIFEVNGDIVIMTRDYDAHTPVLYRYIFDGATGSLKKTEKLLSLDQINFASGFAMAMGGIPIPDFFVRKDPNSDYYAIVLLNSAVSDRNKRLEIVYYGPDHKEISRAFYVSPAEKYKYLKFMDMAVIGGDKVSVLAYAYNTPAHGGKEGEPVLATLDAGAKAVTLDELPLSRDLVVRHGCTRYNPVSKKLMLMAVTQVGRRDEYATVVAFIDPYEKKLLSAKSLFPQKVNDQCEALFGRKNGFTGVPVNVFPNADGSFTVVYEELTEITQTSQYGGGNMTSSETGNMAVCRYDASGKEQQSYLIPKKHFVVKYFSLPFYHSEQELTATELYAANQYKAFAYVDGKDKSYVLFNDIERNGETAQKGKLTTIREVKECDAFYFPLEGANLMPDRQFVFGRPAEKKEHNLALFSISDYDRDNNVYTTLELEKEGRAKQVRVVWLQPE